MITRLKEFIDSLGLSISAFEQKIGASDGMIRRAVKNNTDIQSKWLLKMHDNFHDLNLEWLITGEGTMLKSEEVTLDMPEKAKTNVIPIDFTKGVDTIDIPIVEIYEAAGYGAFNSDYIEQSGSITLPASMVKRGKHYCVRIEGHSMSPTIQDSDYVIVRLLDPYDWKDMPDEHVYLVVDRDGAAYMKRVKNRFEKGFIVCTSDSIEKNVYPNFNLQADHIANIFHAEWHFSAKMQNINETYYSRLRLLEDDMADMKEYLKKIKQ